MPQKPTLTMLWHSTTKTGQDLTGGPQTWTTAAANGQRAVAFRAAEDELTGLVRALNEYFLPHTNKDMNRDHFRQSKQKKYETTDQYYARLCSIATGCENQDQEGEIKTQFIQGIKSRKLRWLFRSQIFLLTNCLKKQGLLKRSTTTSMMWMVNQRKQLLC